MKKKKQEIKNITNYGNNGDWELALIASLPVFMVLVLMLICQ